MWKKVDCEGLPVLATCCSVTLHAVKFSSVCVVTHSIPSEPRPLQSDTCSVEGGRGGDESTI